LSADFKTSTVATLSPFIGDKFTKITKITKKIRLLGQKRMFYLKTSVFDLEVLFLRPERFCLAVD
jgi:hypothetical protein